MTYDFTFRYDDRNHQLGTFTVRACDQDDAVELAYELAERDDHMVGSIIRRTRQVR